MRDKSIQKDRMRFRRNLERMGEIFAYEISKTLDFENFEVETPLGISPASKIKKDVVLATVLRAGLPLHNGLLNYFDGASNAFISAFRSHHKDGSFEVRMQYLTSPDLNNKILIMADPMIATGASVEKCLEALLDHGNPAETHLVTVLASTYAVSRLERLYPEVKLWIGAVDEELTAKSYIVPGLGDAGDLCFGSKNNE